MQFKLIITVCACALFVACSKQVPSQAVAVDSLPSIYPDYNAITIPANIAPLNFKVNNLGSEVITCLRNSAGQNLVVSGRTLDIDIAQWHRLLSQSQGDTLRADVYVKDASGWKRYKPVWMAVTDSIDKYLSYRIIEPSYVNYEVMRIAQRSLEDFAEKDIFNNCTFTTQTEGQCINCHAYQAYNATGNMQMHVRGANGGTLVVRGDSIEKINLKTPGAISPGVYPAWHPFLPLIAYSQNSTQQVFHSANRNKVEVYDHDSRLVLYDVDSHKLMPIIDEASVLETFPSWSLDGKHLYYVAAQLPDSVVGNREQYVIENFKDVKYDIYRLPFDEASRTFGAVDTIFKASELGKSATHPRVSPDGRFLMFTMGDYGTFHIWHHEADIWLMDLQSREAVALDAVNSNDTESYHSFSSNGRWVVISSRRDDGDFTRLYLAHFDADGRASKPFLLPQSNPDLNLSLYKSYNVPEFMVALAATSRPALLNAIGSADCVTAVDVAVEIVAEDGEN